MVKVGYDGGYQNRSNHSKQQILYYQIGSNLYRVFLRFFNKSEFNKDKSESIAIAIKTISCINMKAIKH